MVKGVPGKPPVAGSIADREPAQMMKAPAPRDGGDSVASLRVPAHEVLVRHIHPYLANAVQRCRVEVSAESVLQSPRAYPCRSGDVIQTDVLIGVVVDEYEGAP